MIDVVSDLVGEIVEIYAWRDSSSQGYWSLRGRGVARAIYVADQRLMILVEHNLGSESGTYDDRLKDGGLEIYSLHDGRTRVVQRCGRCGVWDQKAFLFQSGSLPDDGDGWEHKPGTGCKKRSE